MPETYLALGNICNFLKFYLLHLYIEGVVLIYLLNPFFYIYIYTESQYGVVVKSITLEMNSWDPIPTLPFAGSVSLNELLNLSKSHFTHHYGLINSSYFRTSSL